MGKKSLTKSTSPKKAGSKKAQKKTVAVKKITVSAKKKVPPSKTKTAPAPKKAAPMKNKPAAVKKPLVEKKNTAVAPAVKKATPPKPKKLSLKEITFKKFNIVQPDKPFSVKGKPVGSFSAPPFISASSKKEEKRLKNLLFAKFDMAEIRSSAEKAAAEKIVADKAVAAAEKVPVQKPAVEKDPMQRVLFGAAFAFILVVLLLVGSSMKNSAKYYLVPVDGDLQIWQGKFSPRGERLLISLPGVEAPQEIQTIYTKTDVYPYAFSYFVDKADALLEVRGTPDYEGVKAYINAALPYGCTPELRNAAYIRLNAIELYEYMFKAIVAASKNTIAGHETAIDLLNKAAALDTDTDQAEITSRIAKSKAAITSLKEQEELAKQKAIEAAESAAEKAEAEAKAAAEAAKQAESATENPAESD